jgi:phosphohistidine phosphatase SixA
MSFQSRVLCIIALTLSALAPNLAMAETKFIYLTRHAEKSTVGNDPALTTEGQTRAQNIAATLKHANIGSIYSTSALRTQQTAAPLGAFLTLPVQTYNGNLDQLPSFAALLKGLPGNTLVVGHTDTTPELIRLLEGGTVPAIPETEFDRLYQLAIDSNGTVTTTLLRSLPSATLPPCAAVVVNKPNLTTPTNTWLYYTIAVPECANTLTVTISGGTGDADLHVKFGSQPVGTDAACRPYKPGNAENCVITNPQAGIWHIGIKAFAGFAGLTMNASATQ